MPKPEMIPLNLASIARGAAIELFDKSMNDVAKNIADTDTAAEAARSITITFKFKPESAEEHSSKAYIGKTTDGQVIVLDQDPRQDVLFETPVKDDNLLNFKAGEQA